MGRAQADGSGRMAAFVRQRHRRDGSPRRQARRRGAPVAFGRAGSGGGNSRRLTRSRQEIEAARLLADAGFAAQAVSRAYYAAFYAAEQALGSLGESRSKHSGVIAAFSKVAVREGLDDEM